jgi:Ca2+-binding RTX toxin-like protein
VIDLFQDRFGLAMQGGVHTLDTIVGTDDADSLDGASGDDVIRGKGGNDTIHAADGNDSVDGGDGDDSIFGGEGVDTLLGGLGSDTLIGSQAPDDTGNSLNGGDGTDFLVVVGGGNTLDGGSGTDALIFFGDGDELHGGDDADQITNMASGNAGSASDVIVFGDDGDDLLWVGLSAAKGDVASSVYGGAGNDTLNIFAGELGHLGSLLSGGDGDDLIKARSAGDDTIDGGTGFDIVSYIGRAYGITADLVEGTAHGKGVGHDSLTSIEGFIGGINDDVATGDSLANSLAGKNGNDVLIGGAGDDTIDGGGLADTITGGQGADHMNGGGGADTFVYNSVTESTDAARDVIDHLKKHDVIDLSAIDADVNTAGDQAFTRVAAFDGHAGQMTLTFSGGVTLLQVDVDGDAQADMTIQLTGHVTGHTEFVL